MKSCQPALIDKRDGTTLLDINNIDVRISKNGGKFTKRDSKEPCVCSIVNDETILEIPLSEKDTDTTGVVTVCAEMENSLLSVGTVIVDDKQGDSKGQAGESKEITN